VDYDLVSQAQAMGRMGEVLNEAGRRLAGKGGAAPRLRVVLLGLFAVATAGALALVARRMRFRRPGTRAAQRPAPDQRRAMQLWRQARQQLQRAGVPLTPATTPREAADAAQLPAVSELVSAYLAARWGGELLAPQRAHALLRNLHDALA